jgi:hypothetical protein
MSLKEMQSDPFMILIGELIRQRQLRTPMYWYW